MPARSGRNSATRPARSGRNSAARPPVTAAGARGSRQAGWQSRHAPSTAAPRPPPPPHADTFSHTCCASVTEQTTNTLAQTEGGRARTANRNACKRKWYSDCAPSVCGKAVSVERMCGMSELINELINQDVWEYAEKLPSQPQLFIIAKGDKICFQDASKLDTYLLFNIGGNF